MKEIKVGIYDWLACLVPGSLVVWAVVELFLIFGVDVSKSQILTMPATGQVVFLLIISYATGQMLHALGNHTIDRRTVPGTAPGGYFYSQYERDFSQELREEINKQVARYYHLDANKPNLITSCYWACYSAVMETYTESKVDVFLSLAGFSRGMAAAGFLIALVYAAVGALTGVWNLPKEVMGLGVGWMFLVVIIFSALLGWLFLGRVSRFRFYLAKTVCVEFLNICEQRQTAPIQTQRRADD